MSTKRTLLSSFFPSLIFRFEKMRAMWYFAGFVVTLGMSSLLSLMCGVNPNLGNVISAAVIWVVAWRTRYLG
jgi:hypothetical protein